MFDSPAQTQNFAPTTRTSFSANRFLAVSIVIAKGPPAPLLSKPGESTSLAVPGRATQWLPCPADNLTCTFSFVFGRLSAVPRDSHPRGVTRPGTILPSENQRVRQHRSGVGQVSKAPSERTGARQSQTMLFHTFIPLKNTPSPLLATLARVPIVRPCSPRLDDFPAVGPVRILREPV